VGPRRPFAIIRQGGLLAMTNTKECPRQILEACGAYCCIAKDDSYYIVASIDGVVRIAFYLFVFRGCQRVKFERDN
jgi:hypothetical protein